MASNGPYLSLPIRAVALSAAVVSAAAMLRLSGPTIVRLASDEIPKVYGSFASWLTPPYLYLLINGIIISIAAASRFHKSAGSDEGVIGSESEPVIEHRQFVVVAEEEEEVKVDHLAPAAAEYELPKEEEAELVISRTSIWTPMSKETETGEVTVDPLLTGDGTETAVEIPTERSLPTEKEAENYILPLELSVLAEKPPVSARLGRRKSLKASPDPAGKVLGVARPKRNDTLESTWKAITDGRAVPLARHLKKSDTWETHHHHETHSSRGSDPSSSPDPAPMGKSETFDGRDGSRCPATAAPSSRLIRKEPSLGQDDLNRKVEAFIKKFNEEMRLQRQESYQHYLDMINNRGSHR